MGANSVSILFLEAEAGASGQGLEPVGELGVPWVWHPHPFPACKWRSPYRRVQRCGQPSLGPSSACSGLPAPAEADPLI